MRRQQGIPRQPWRQESRQYAFHFLTNMLYVCLMNLPDFESAWGTSLNECWVGLIKVQGAPRPAREAKQQENIKNYQKWTSVEGQRANFANLEICLVMFQVAGGVLTQPQGAQLSQG